MNLRKTKKLLKGHIIYGYDSSLGHHTVILMYPFKIVKYKDLFETRGDMRGLHKLKYCIPGKFLNKANIGLEKNHSWITDYPLNHPIILGTKKEILSPNGKTEQIREQPFYLELNKNINKFLVKRFNY